MEWVHDGTVTNPKLLMLNVCMCVGMYVRMYTYIHTCQSCLEMSICDTWECRMSSSVMNMWQWTKLTDWVKCVGGQNVQLFNQTHTVLLFQKQGSGRFLKGFESSTWEAIVRGTLPPSD